MLVNVSSKAHLIQKEIISSCKFPSTEVLCNKEAQRKRIHLLKLAAALGNRFKQKVRIFFKDNLAEKFVETTVWMAGDKYVSLKNGVLIPVCRIQKVKLL